MIGETDMGVCAAPTLPEGECATGWLYAAVEPSSLHYQSDFDMFTSGFVTSTHVVSSEPCLSRVRVRLHRKDTPKPQVPMDPIPVCPYSQNAISSTPEPLRACIPYYSPPGRHTSTPFPNLSLGSCLGSRYTQTRGRQDGHPRICMVYASTLRPFFCPFSPCSAHKREAESEARRTQGITQGIAQGITHSFEHPRHMTSDPLGGMLLRRAARHAFTVRCHGAYVLSARPRSLYGKLTFFI